MIEYSVSCFRYAQDPAPNGMAVGGRWIKIICLSKEALWTQKAFGESPMIL
jgi:hypothetical protein